MLSRQSSVLVTILPGQTIKLDKTADNGYFIPGYRGELQTLRPFTRISGQDSEQSGAKWILEFAV